MSAGTTSVTEDIYQEHILDHFESPYHKGHLAHPTCCHRDKNPLCGDVIELQLKIDANDRVSEAYFDGKGCAISQAAASMLMQEVEGKSLSEVQKFTGEEMLDLFGARLTPNRQKCCLLSWRVLQSALFSRIDHRKDASGPRQSPPHA